MPPVNLGTAVLLIVLVVLAIIGLIAIFSGNSVFN